jgi:transposase-like protein
MIELKELIKNLSASEKASLIRILKTEAMDESNRFKNGVICPHCQSLKVKKCSLSPTRIKRQRYKCKNCKKCFSFFGGTILNRTRKDLQMWKDYIDYMFDGYSIKEIAELLEITRVTAFRWRHKILSVLEKKFMNDELSGIVEMDETFVREAQKGCPWIIRPTRKLRGISHQQTGILVAIDRNNNVVSRVYGQGRITTTQVKKILHKRIDKKSLLITDGCKAYIKFAKDENLDLKQLKDSTSVVSKVYHINHVNSYHSYLKDFLKGFRGISTKNLDKYLAWFKFAKQKGKDLEFLFNNLILDIK